MDRDDVKREIDMAVEFAEAEAANVPVGAKFSVTTGGITLHCRKRQQKTKTCHCADIQMANPEELCPACLQEYNDWLDALQEQYKNQGDM